MSDPSELVKDELAEKSVLEAEKSQDQQAISQPIDNASENHQHEKANSDIPKIDHESEIFRELIKKIDFLQVSFDEKIKFDLSKENQIASLHSELQTYKSGLMIKILKPLVLDLISIHDNVGKISAEHKKSVSELKIDVYESFQTDIEDTLYRYGFEAFSTGDDVIEFDSKRQRVAKTIVSNDASMDRKIAERLRKGFTYEGIIIRPEMVTVYTYKAPTNL